MYAGARPKEATPAPGAATESTRTPSLQLNSTEISAWMFTGILNSAINQYDRLSRTGTSGWAGHLTTSYHRQLWNSSPYFLLHQLYHRHVPRSCQTQLETIAHTPKQILTAPRPQTHPNTTSSLSPSPQLLHPPSHPTPNGTSIPFNQHHTSLPTKRCI